MNNTNDTENPMDDYESPLPNFIDIIEPNCKDPRKFETWLHNHWKSIGIIQ
jgi:hypothetical protein